MVDADAERGSGSSAVKETWEAFARSRFDAAGSDKDARAQAMERELAASNAAVVLARRLRNAGVSAACGLPTEVLTIILLYLRSVWSPGRVKMPEGGWNLTPGWMTVLQVCSLWREVVIKTPVLWAFIPCSELSTNYIPLFLSRSRGLPLEIEFITYSQDFWRMSMRFWFSATVLRRARAIRYIESSIPESPGAWQELFKHTLPHLDALDISLVHRTDSNLITPDMFLPPSDRPHPIRRLELSDCYLPLGSPLLSPNLTHLTLSSSEPPSEGSTFKVSDLIGALPHLQQLQLLNIFPDTQEMHGPSTLPSCFELLQLKVEHAPTVLAACLHLIEHLRLPPAATACLDLFMLHGHTEVGSVLKKFFEYDARSAVELQIEDAMFGVLYGERPREEWTRSSSEAAELLAIDRVHGARHIFSTEPSVTAMLSCINLTHLKSVYLFDSALKVALLEDLLGTLASATALHRIALQSPWQCQALLHALGQCSASQTAQAGSPQLLFPQLEVIIIHDDGGEDPGDDKEMAAKISCLTAVFLDLLERRSGNGAPVRELMVDEALKDWDVWKMVDSSTVVTFFENESDTSWPTSF